MKRKEEEEKMRCAIWFSGESIKEKHLKISEDLKLMGAQIKEEHVYERRRDGYVIIDVDDSHVGVVEKYCNDNGLECAKNITYDLAF